jgi:putative transposase
MGTTGKPAPVVVLDSTQKEQLEVFAQSRSLGHSLVVRARIILEAARGQTNSAIARQVGFNEDTVGKWRIRYLENGIEGLYDEVRSGRPRSIGEDKIAQVIQQTLDTKPEGATQWSVRSAAEATGLSKSTIQRVWATFGLKPHRTRSFKLSTDPFFIEKVIDIVGLYLNPPSNALVLCVDEKSQCQALERTQPNLPLDLGYVEGYTHDYTRHGTTTLFSALNVATGTVLNTFKEKHRHQEFVAFLREVDKNIPKDLAVHVIADNYATHKHAAVKAWLAKHPRYQFHFTPTYSSWLNQVERWFGLVTEKAIRRGSFTSVKDLIQKIDAFVKAYNKTATPFKWTATAESILAKVERLCLRISGTPH